MHWVYALSQSRHYLLSRWYHLSDLFKNWKANAIHWTVKFLQNGNWKFSLFSKHSITANFKAEKHFRSTQHGPCSIIYQAAKAQNNAHDINFIPSSEYWMAAEHLQVLCVFYSKDAILQSPCENVLLEYKKFDYVSKIFVNEESWEFNFAQKQELYPVYWIFTCVSWKMVGWISWSTLCARQILFWKIILTKLLLNWPNPSCQ